MIESNSSDSVITIDCNYIYPQIAASYLIIEDRQAVFIETNTSHAVPIMIETLNQNGLSPEQVEKIIITHIHLDHCGGTSLLLKQCPNAEVLVHPRASKHIIDPERLVSSAKMVYGDDTFQKLYGDIEGVPEERVRIMKDYETISIGRRELTFIHTRGHANHHFCIHDSKSNGIFTGDSFGLAYPHLQNGNRQIIYPSTTPTDFDPALARESIKKITDTGATHAYLTHFGPFYDMTEGAKQMLESLDSMESILEEAVRKYRSGDDHNKFCYDRVKSYFEDELKNRGIEPDQTIKNILKIDMEISAMGIAYTASRKK